MRKIMRFLTSRLFLTSVSIFLQLAFMMLLITALSAYSVFIYAFLTALSFIMVLFVASGNNNPSFRLAWVIPMMIFPIFGWLLYYLFSMRKPYHKTIGRLDENKPEIRKRLDECCEEAVALPDDFAARRQIHYLSEVVGAKICDKTTSRFFPCGEEFFPVYLSALKTATSFIFIEYFIISEGRMWGEILEILKKKAAEGVTVRVMYDDMGSISLLPKDYSKQLGAFGIEAAAFNPYHASIDVFQNSRDHRKITVIDGKIGFTGGINLCDEYINEKTRFGYWKDCALELRGKAVASMTAMFLRLWHFTLRSKVTDDDNRFFRCDATHNDGLFAVFSDDPYDDITAGKSAYMSIIMGACRYVCIATPYLIVDSEMLECIKLCAESGVSVKIVTPHIPDKIYVHAVTRSNYSTLIKSGVEIYEYCKGFIHSKMIVADDEFSIVGTVNFDFRSFYLHFENGVYMYRSEAVGQVKSDFEGLLPDCVRIGIDDCKPKTVFHAIARSFLRLFAPLM